jgi:hypothetical protein
MVGEKFFGFLVLPFFFHSYFQTYDSVFFWSIFHFLLCGKFFLGGWEVAGLWLTNSGYFIVYEFPCVFDTFMKKVTFKMGWKASN